MPSQTAVHPTDDNRPGGVPHLTMCGTTNSVVTITIPEVHSTPLLLPVEPNLTKAHQPPRASRAGGPRTASIRRHGPPAPRGRLAEMSYVRFDSWHDVLAYVAAGRRSTTKPR